jgi:hypothetical protein
LTTSTIVIRLLPYHIIEFFNIFFNDVKLSPHYGLIRTILGAGIVLGGLQTQTNQVFHSLEVLISRDARQKWVEFWNLTDNFLHFYI